MNLFKRLFYKRKEPSILVNVNMPFDIGKVRFPEKYISGLLEVIKNEEET